MTFVLKNLDELKKNFEITKDIMLRYNQITNIKDLHEPRRSEMLLLQSVLKKIEQQINEVDKSQEKTELHIQNYLAAYYGAMLVARHDTNDPDGKLSKSLAKTLELNTENKPNTYNTTKFHLEFNIFLQSQLFKNNDLRQELKDEHIFSAINNEDLYRLLKISYELERNSRKTLVAALAKDGKKEFDIKRYCVNKETPASATAHFNSFFELTKELNDLTIEECADKNKGDIDDLGQKRAAQINFLIKIGELLEHSTIDDSEKTAVLAGSMHLIHQQIDNEYRILSSKNSVICSGLKNLLNIDQVAPQDVEALLHAANRFILRISTGTQPISRQKDGLKKAINENNPFATIKKFDLIDILSLCQDMICEYRKKSIKQIFAELIQSEKQESRWPSIGKVLTLNGLFNKNNEKSDTNELSSTITTATIK